MVFFEWTKKYATGIAGIDADHENLFMIINVLHDNVEKNGPEAEITPVLTALGEYVKRHFLSEEKEMRRAGYPEIAKHIAEHRAISRRIQACIDQGNEHPNSINALELLDFLKDWLANHVLKSDMEYVPYVNRANEPPATNGP